MSKATSQSLCILSAIKSGLISSHQEYQDLSHQFKAMLFKADELCANAIGEWKASERDLGRAMYFLGCWVDKLKETGLHETNNLTTLIAMSQQSTNDLLGVVKDKKKIALLEPIIEVLDDMGDFLHTGIKDKVLIPRFELADKILYELYLIMGFEV